MWYNVVAATQPIQDAIQRLADWTVLFRRGEYLFVTFGLFAGLAALAASVWAGWLLLAQGVPFVEAAPLLAGCLTGHLVVARAFLLPWSLAGLRSQPLRTLRN